MRLKKVSYILFLIAIFSVAALQFGQVKTFAEGPITGPITQPITSPLLNGIVGYWKFDGNTNDSSGNSNKGTVVVNGNLGTLNYSSDVPSSSFNQSGNFDGSTYVEVYPNDTINFSEKMTLSAWVKITAWDGGQYPTMISKQASYALGLRSSDTRVSDVIYSNGGSSRRLWGNPGLEAGRWYHMVMTYDRDGGENNVKHYQDGVLIAQMTYGAIDSADWSSLYLGQGGIKGLIDEAMVYNRVLSQEEITDLFNNNF